MPAPAKDERSTENGLIMTIKLKVMSAADLSLTNHNILCGWFSLPESGIVVLNKWGSLSRVIEKL